MSNDVGGLGFISFSEFNINLLQKYFWRMLVREKYLLRRLFKSKYFPRCLILEAKAGFSPNYAWRM